MQRRPDPADQLAEHPGAFLTRAPAAGAGPDSRSGSEPAAARARRSPAGPAPGRLAWIPAPRWRPAGSASLANGQDNLFGAPRMAREPTRIRAHNGSRSPWGRDVSRRRSGQVSGRRRRRAADRQPELISAGASPGRGRGAGGAGGDRAMNDDAAQHGRGNGKAMSAPGSPPA